MVIWEVLTRDGIPLCQCGCEQDAIAIASFVAGRTYRRLLRIAPEIIDVELIKVGELPGNLGLPGRGPQVEGGELKSIAEGEGAPLQCAENV
jgi:hypothetical protein